MRKLTILLFTILFGIISTTSKPGNETIVKENSTSQICVGEFELGDKPTLKGISNGTASTIFGLIALASFAANVLIIHVVRVNLNMHTTTNYLILNMAIGDMISSVVTATWTIKYLQAGVIWTGNGLFGEYVYCKLGWSLYYVSMICSIYSLTVMTFDRFLAVTRPLQHMHRSSWLKHYIGIIWVACFTIPAHYIIEELTFCEKSEGQFFCVPKKSPFDALIIVIIGYAVPHISIIALYAVIAYTLYTRKVVGESNNSMIHQKAARKASLMILCVLVAFEVSWAPLFLGHIFRYLYLEQGANFEVLIASKSLMISNGIFNAFIYASFNENFRNGFRKVFSRNMDV